jgi:hypothetical protein
MCGNQIDFRNKATYDETRIALHPWRLDRMARLRLRSSPLVCSLVVYMALVSVPLLCPGWCCALEAFVAGQGPAADCSRHSHDSTASDNHHSDQSSECFCAEAICTCSVLLNKAYSHLRGQDASQQDVSQPSTAALDGISTHLIPDADPDLKDSPWLTTVALLKLHSVFLTL